MIHVLPAFLHIDDCQVSVLIIASGVFHNRLEKIASLILHLRFLKEIVEKFQADPL